jgi:hypothetical protein
MYRTKAQISLFEKWILTSLNVRFLRVTAPCGFFLFVCMCLVLVLTECQHPKTKVLCLSGFESYCTAPKCEN